MGLCSFVHVGSSQGIKRILEICEETATLTAGHVDLNVDSNNDGGIDEADDAIEDLPFSPAFPGKYGWVNADDSDGDGHFVGTERGR